MGLTSDHSPEQECTQAAKRGSDNTALKDDQQLEMQIPGPQSRPAGSETLQQAQILCFHSLGGRGVGLMHTHAWPLCDHGLLG